MPISYTDIEDKDFNNHMILEKEEAIAHSLGDIIAEIEKLKKRLTVLIKDKEVKQCCDNMTASAQRICRLTDELNVLVGVSAD